LLLAAAFFLVLSVLLGVLSVRRAAPRITVERTITPFQVHDGDRAIVEVSLVSHRRISQAITEDVVQRLGTASFVADRIEPDEPMLARYEVLCRPRGVYQVGPAAVKVRDPLEMAEFAARDRAIDRLVVYPVVEDLQGVPITRGQDPNATSARANYSQAGGEDFYTLREYQRGDDLRRVHWPSSARRDVLMIRQLETPWQSRALVIVDPRASAYPTDDAFEQAVRGAASVTRHLYRNGFSPVVWTGSGAETPVGGSDSYRTVMENLATVTPIPDLDLRALMHRLRRRGLSGGALVLVTGRPDMGSVPALHLLARDFTRTVVMAATQTDTDATLQMRMTGTVLVLAGPGSAWAPAWREALEQSWSTATAG
ncbi:MAG: DUF58 domain-containing protein, partial [Acidimicrobiia bacterium]